MTRSQKPNTVRYHNDKYAVPLPPSPKISFPYLFRDNRLKVSSKLHHSKSSGIPDLVTELAITFNTQDIQVDVTSTSSVSTEGESQSIGTTFRNTLGEIRFL